MDPAIAEGRLLHLGGYGGHGPKANGAVCRPADFSGVVTVPTRILGPCDGRVTVHLVEPGHALPPEEPGTVTRRVFQDVSPWLVVSVSR